MTWSDKVIETTMKINIEHPTKTKPIHSLPNNSLFIYENELYVKMFNRVDRIETCIVSENDIMGAQKCFTYNVAVYPVKEITVKY